MTEKARFVLRDPQQGHLVLTHQVWPMLKNMLIAGHEMTVECKPSKRSLDQNAKFHAICDDFSRSGIEWAGKQRTAAEWKVLIVSGHSVATKQGAEIIPGIEGEFVNVRESTALMSKARGSSLIEYAMAFGAQHGVKFRAHE